jgi:hypothetical protein
MTVPIKFVKLDDDHTDVGKNKKNCRFGSTMTAGCKKEREREREKQRDGLALGNNRSAT